MITFTYPKFLIPHIFYDDIISSDITIIGSGAAGLSAGISAAKTNKKILIINNNDSLSSSSMLAQGGIACVWDKLDNFKSHIDDTLQAGAFFNNKAAVDILIKEGKKRIEDLINMGMEFDSDNEGIILGKEGAHSHRRILHSGGDASGRNLTEFLLNKVKKIPEISFLDNYNLISFIVNNGICRGVIISNKEKIYAIKSNAVIIASGGYSKLFGLSTQPDTNTGQVLGAAFLSGAILQDLEFIQFHPTGFIKKDGSAFLITEALRGEGAYLVNDKNERFMLQIHNMSELAPRDIVSREMIKQNKTFLDARHLDADFIKKRFPTIFKVCMENGYDISRELLPVSPVAHYSIGGIKTDLYGKTNIKGLFACGEAASNGCHGANRLASNSLLETLVFGYRAGKTASEYSESSLYFPSSESLYSPSLDDFSLESIKKTMLKEAGPFRNGKNLKTALSNIISEINKESSKSKRFNIPRYNSLIACFLIIYSAFIRKESRGAHFRTDFPNKSDEWNKRINLSISGLTFSSI